MSGQFSNRFPLFFFSLLLALALIIPLKVRAEEKKTQGLFSEGGPIEITSDRLIADNTGGRATFEGHVKAKQGQTTLSSDWMEVQYTKEGEISTIHARGNVVVTKADQRVQAEEAYYYRDSSTVLFLGNPVAEDSNTIIRGTKITYHLDTGNSEVENSHLTIKKKERKQLGGS
ncbi:MAG: hypothetical protein D6710_10885 [Nitrospirae bacterium]|nr:MAG: hypothetical protein D6710_10885 [Nitrospirota bacterium]